MSEVRKAGASAVVASVTASVTSPVNTFLVRMPARGEIAA